MAEEGWRLDALLAIRFPDYSRVHLRRVIYGRRRADRPAWRRTGLSRTCRPATVGSTLPEIPREAPRPENIPLEILYPGRPCDRGRSAAGDGGASGPGALVGHAGRRALQFPFWRQSQSVGAVPIGRASCIAWTATLAA